jgi:hypothetical protein
MNRRQLEAELEERFGESAGLGPVSRQAQDLAAAQQIDEDLGFELTIETIISNLEDAPEDHTVVERWNWWIRSLELSHGSYQRFRVRPDLGDS